MKDYFFSLCESLFQSLREEEVMTVNLEAERSDFIRLNNNRVRQAGHVNQAALSLDLIHGQRHCGLGYELSGHMNEDLHSLKHKLERLRELLPHLPEDPYLHYASDGKSSEETSEAPDFAAESALGHIHGAAQELDLVGIYASGWLYKGFANSLGQRNWHATANFNFDWSLYHHGDKAVKCAYSGRRWQQEILEEKLATARRQLELLARPARRLSPGKYRVYLAPAAMQELVDMLAWGGFSLKAERTAQSPLQLLVTGDEKLSGQITLSEEHQRGLGPHFTSEGFAKPARVELIRRGEYAGTLINSRSSREYGLPVNSGSEYPGALHLNPGSLAANERLQALDTGIYINNLWYCNFSDRNHCRITGMTRFACFWVEQGQIVAPIDVMRFDDSIYHILGKNLIAIDDFCEEIHDAGSYEQRSERCYWLPGALTNDFNLTL